jgi:hypothetical protein
MTPPFSSAYRTHLQHLKLKGLQPKTIDAHARAIRRMGDYFDFAIDKLSPTQLTHYFSDLVASHSWTVVKLKAPAESCHRPMRRHRITVSPPRTRHTPDLILRIAHSAPKALCMCPIKNNHTLPKKCRNGTRRTAVRSLEPSESSIAQAIQKRYFL